MLESVALGQAPSRTSPLADALTRLVPQFFQRAAERDESGAFPREEFQALHEAGALVAPVPVALGGLGYGLAPTGVLPLLSLLRDIGRGSLPLGRLYEGHANAWKLIADFANAEQQERWASDARAGHIFGVWNTEIPHEAVSFHDDGSALTLEGAKIFASGAGNITRPVVTGRREDGTRQMAVVPTDAAKGTIDRTAWRPMGMEASTSYRVDFSGVRLERENILGQPDDYTREPWFSGGAIRFAAVQAGGAEALLQITRDHLQKRKRTDCPHQQKRAGEMAIAVASARHWLAEAARHAERADEAPERFLAHSRLTRSAVEQACLQALEHAERSVGLPGMVRPHPLERVVRDLRMYLRQPSPDKALTEAGRYFLEATTPVDRLWNADD